MSRVLRCIGMDPGIKNYALSVLEIEFFDTVEGKNKSSSSGIDLRVIKTGLLKNPMFDVNTDVVTQSRMFEEEVQRIIHKFKPDIVCAERFQNRGFRAGGSQMEAVNLMLGVLTSMEVFDTVSLKLVSPMVWKAAVKKQHDLKELYKRCVFPVHELDSTLIGLYGAYSVTHQTPFSCQELSVDENIDNILNQIVSVTRSRIKQKRVKREK